MKSLAAQVSALTRLTAVNPEWLLVDVYIDIASSKIGSSHKEFTRMLKDCKSLFIHILLGKFKFDELLALPINIVHLPLWLINILRNIRITIQVAYTRAIWTCRIFH